MKADKLQLVIFEKEKDIINVWEDFFSDSYNLSFINNNSNQTLDKISFNDKTIFICNTYIKNNDLNKINNNLIIFLNDNNKVSKSKAFKLSKKRYFIKPISLKEIDNIIKEINYTYYLKVYEKIGIKNLFLLPFDRKLASADNKEYILLTEKEVSILIELNKNKKIIKKEQLLTDIWGYNSEINTSTLETHIHRLRQKLKKFSEKIMIKTINGGYYIV